MLWGVGRGIGGLGEFELGFRLDGMRINIHFRRLNGCETPC